VDPYYLTHQAERLGYHPEVILAGRRINDGMGRFVARETVKCLVAAGRPVNGAAVTVLGITFKENCPDLRNSRVVDVIGELRSFGVTVQVHDPRADAQEAMAEHGIALVAWEALAPADAVVIAVAHREFAALAPDELAGRIVPGGCLVDVKGVADREAALARGLAYWRL
jgi:UDP-N-acetyl-D-galactosamine dehydrogenase